MEISFDVPSSQIVPEFAYDGTEQKLKEAISKIHDLLKSGKSIGKGCPFLLDFEDKLNHREKGLQNMTILQREAFDKWEKAPHIAYERIDVKVFDCDRTKKNYGDRLEAVRYITRMPHMDYYQAEFWIDGNPDRNRLLANAAESLIRAKRHAYGGYESHDDKHTIEQLACGKLIKKFEHRHVEQIQTTDGTVQLIQGVIAGLKDRIQRLSIGRYPISYPRE